MHFRRSFEKLVARALKGKLGTKRTGSLESDQHVGEHVEATEECFVRRVRILAWILLLPTLADMWNVVASRQKWVEGIRSLAEGILLGGESFTWVLQAQVDLGTDRVVLK